MTPIDPQSCARAAWELSRQQQDVIARRQLFELGFSDDAIRHRLASGRLYRIYRGVYAVGRRDVSQLGRWMAAVLRCGEGAALSHSAAAALWRMRPIVRGTIEVSVVGREIVEDGLLVHRRARLDDIRVAHGIPVTNPAETLIDMAARLDRDALEAALNDADKHDLVTHDSLAAAVERAARRPGTAALRKLLSDHTFRRTDTELERQFLRIVRDAGLPLPLTQQHVNGHRVDFYWPALRVVVETDGGRFHRTGSEQTRDRERDHAHLAAGLTPLRFTHAQIFQRAAHVEAVLRAVVAPRLLDVT
ncbi:MAG: DUF559 domain-containing protein [Thermoleophilaceae bacterium]